MDLKQIERLMTAMKETKIKRLVLKQEDFEIELESESSMEFSPTSIRGVESYGASPSLLATSHESSKSTPSPAVAALSDAKYVTSPMVGTFYSSPSPEDPPFVRVGDSVNENTVICIIEAMKVMNEVKAGMKGKVAEILLKNGDPLEFGTKIFRIDVL